MHHHQRPPIRIPYNFLATIAPAIQTIEELQVCLAFFRLLAKSHGDETPISEQAILDDRPLRDALRQSGRPNISSDRISKGLELAVGRGTLLRFLATHARHESVWYYLNSPVNRSLVAAMERGTLKSPAIVWQSDAAPAISVDPSNIYRLYEQNIGALTPIVADQLTQAAEDYPADWIEDAIEEAVTYNKRSWRYILRILENWRASGRDFT